MTRTVTAFFDNRTEAEEAKARLASSSIDADRIRIIDQSSSGTGLDSTGHKQERPGEHGFMASLRELFMPEEDTQTYGEGIRRGGYLVCASVYEHEAEEAVQILENSNSVDLDQRQQDWRNDGWSGYDATSSTNTQAFGGAGLSSQGTTGTQSRQMEEEHIPLVEEELRIGKREVERGGARVRSYVREVPVHEQVTLREEHVSVERRPVNEPLGRDALDGNSDLLRDRTVEMVEHAEEAVVAKEAHVREEVVVKKTAEERVEQIDDTVRRTEVDVQEGTAGTSGSKERSAFGGFGENRTSGDTSVGGTDTTREREAEGSGYSPRIDKSGL